jgi:hypothetical protein
MICSTHYDCSLSKNVISVLSRARDSTNAADAPVALLPCKLLLNENINPDEGRLERLIEHPHDFDKWKNDEDLRGKVTLATNENSRKLDADEFFDYAMPTIVLRKFMDLTPVEITSHKFCDLRFLAVVDKLSTGTIQMGQNDATPWLLAHYKITMHSKHRTFDNDGWIDHGGGVSHIADQSSLGTSDSFTPCDSDVELASRYRNISPRQVAICRTHAESVAIQHYGWDEVEESKKSELFIDEVNKLYGDGFGEKLWSQCCDKFGSMFTSDLLEKNMCAW